MSKKLTFIGDVMLGRMIGSKYANSPYEIVDKGLQAIAKNSDLTIANLESPVTTTKDPNADHLQFVGSEESLSVLKWIDVFTLANNHINDAAEVGMDETISLLEKNGFHHNGLFVKNENYVPYIFNADDYEIAIVMVTDMMNIPFADDNKWQCLRVGDKRVNEIIAAEKSQGRMVIVYAHIGALFTRYPNPTTFDFLHGYVETGADCIVTVHSHCLGGMEVYKGIPIFHSIGDFVMDGNSFRRRRSAMLTLTIEDKKIISWKLVPAEINDELVTSLPDNKTRQKMLKSFDEVTNQIKKHTTDYGKFYKWQYKKEMMHHACSTLIYLIQKRGLKGMLRLVFMRFEEVGRMFKWMATDRSKVQRDDDAIKANRRKFKEEDLFK